MGNQDNENALSGRFQSSSRIQVSEMNEGVRTLIDTVKPDLVAPGVDIETVSVRGGYTRVSGTSYATPMVAGAAALLMEWGIVRGNDPYLYGEKLKAYLIKGARAIPGEEELPDDRAGAYGIIVSS